VRTLFSVVVVLLVVPARAQAPLPPHLWLEAETFGPLKGANFSYQLPEKTTKGSWALSGPGVAPEWTQGGESEFLSIAARADEPAEIAVGREVEVPAAGAYTLWIRYADYRGKRESVGVRVTQAGTTWAHAFGDQPVIDELDPLKLYWDWSFGWASAKVELVKGSAKIELFAPPNAESRRQVDCLCLTTDAAYQPVGREKPEFAAWGPLRAMRKAGMPDVEPLVAPAPVGDIPKAWRISTGPPTFLWNTGQPWLDELKKPAAERFDHPFAVDPPLREAFLKAYRGPDVPVYAHPLSGPVWHVPFYPTVFGEASPFLPWIEAKADKRFAILLNYGEPKWPKGVTDEQKQATEARLRKLDDRFVGYIAGENISYAKVDTGGLHERVRNAKSRADVLAALKDVHTAATVEKFSTLYGRPLTPAEAWAKTISCLSANNEAYAHALAEWGCHRVGHENTGNSPTLARRLAFLRGAARQFGAKLVDYQSINLGDSATMFSREAFFYPGSSRYVLDNQYDVWAGAGVNWLLKDYLLFHLAGVDAFYNEQGVDLFWKPGGNSAGDAFPVQLSPKGKTAEAVMTLAARHPRGTQYTPVAFLLDPAHGYSQERFTPGAFALDPQLNPTVLTPGRHEAAIRGWFDVAYFPAPDTQNQPVSGGRQTYVAGMFGDLFDVIVSTPAKTEIAQTYRAIVASGEVTLDESWGDALARFIDAGGTLVVSADQHAGPGVAKLDLPPLGDLREAAAFEWRVGGAAKYASNVFRYRALPAGDKYKILAAAPDGAPLAVSLPRGKGQIVLITVPRGLGIDDCPTPLLGLVMRHLAQGLAPVRAVGDVEWTLNRLDDGGWVIALLNDRGIDKPQHGVNPTDHRQAQSVRLHAAFKVVKSVEWMTETEQVWRDDGEPAPPGGSGTARVASTTTITVPAGGVRLIEVHSAK